MPYLLISIASKCFEYERQLYFDREKDYNFTRTNVLGEKKSINSHTVVFPTGETD